jgi:drug/metabolite transporter (DMT)-like permease
MAVVDAAPVQVNRTIAAAGAILFYATAIGFTDNYVRVIAAEISLWQFHATRTGFVLLLLAVAMPFLRLDLRPRNLPAVVARSAVHGTALMFYFAALAFLPVAQAAAGLFTAPIFVLLISRFAYGQRIGPFRIFAVGLGFLGIVLVLGPGQQDPLSLASLLPVMGGFFYALGNVATRRWCGDESAVTLTLGFFVAMGCFGLAGMALLALFPWLVDAGADSFVLRGVVVPSGSVLFWTFVQAVGSLMGVAAMVRGYQLADASRVAVFEYVVLPLAAFWGFVLWGDTPTVNAVIGMVLIFATGLLIVLRGK